MKKIILLLITLSLNTYAQSEIATSDTSTSKSDSGYTQFFLGYSFADTIKGKSVIGDLNSGKDNAFMLGGRYVLILPRQFKVSLGAGLETIREMKKADADGVSLDTDAELGFILLEANGHYQFSDSFYGFAGLNFPLIYEDSGYNEIYANLGTQIGLGADVYKEFAVELYYRTVNFDWSVFHKARLWGPAIRATYTF